MKKTLEKLWNEYLSQECATINTDEEKKAIEDAVQLHESLNTLLNESQQCAVEKYTDALHNANSIYAKKAFFKGCEFSMLLILEIMGMEE